MTTSNVLALEPPKPQATTLKLFEENPQKREELYSSVYVVGPEKNIGFAQMLVRAGCTKAPSLEKADICIFTGSWTDVHPSLYGQNLDTLHPSISATLEDMAEVSKEMVGTYVECLYCGIPMVGICGGAQHLHVFNGGSLYQHVSQHYGDHSIWIESTNEHLNSSSCHHQVCIENENMDVLARAYESDKIWRNDHTFFVPQNGDSEVEAFWYENTFCLGVQGHPEYRGYEKFTQWFLKEITDLILYNTDLELNEEGVLRAKQEVLDRSEYKIPENVQNFIKEYC